MLEITIYTANLCGYCTMAKRLLTQKGLNYTFITRQLLKLESRSLFHAKDLIMLFRILRKFNSYKKKGIFIKGFIFKSKISSKKSKV